MEREKEVGREEVGIAVQVQKLRRRIDDDTKDREGIRTEDTEI